jgi:acyl carrier protein
MNESPIVEGTSGRAESADGTEASVGDALRGICQQVLRRDDISMERSFYELGGDSFTLIHFVAAIQQEFDIGLTTELVLGCRTLEDTRQLILSRSGSTLGAGSEQSVSGSGGPGPLDDSGRELAALQELVTPRQGLVSGPVEVAANRHSLFLLKRRHLHHWYGKSTLELTEAVDHAALEKAVQALVHHHDGLRLQGHAQEGEWREVIVVPSACRCLITKEYAGPDESERWREFVGNSLDQICRSFTFPGELFKVLCVEHRQTQRCVVALVAHHLLVDAHSWSVVVHDFLRLYAEYKAGQQPVLPRKTTSLIDYSTATRRYWLMHAHRELKYWASLPWQRLKPLRVDADAADERNIEKHTRFVVRSLRVKDAAEFVSQFSRESCYTFVEVMLGAIAKAYHDWTGHGVLHLSTAFHCRETVIPGMDLTRTVGWINETVPLLLPGAGELGGVLGEVHRQVCRANACGKSYGVLRYLSGDTAARRELDAHPHAPLSLNIRLPATKKPWASQVAQRATWIRPPAENEDATQRVYLISGGVFFDSGNLVLSWDFSSEIFPAEHIEAFAGRCMREFIEAARTLLPHGELSAESDQVA